MAIQQILDDLSDVGLAVNIKPGKSTLYPIKQLIWCGLLWDTLNMTVYIPKERRKNVDVSIFTNYVIEFFINMRAFEVIFEI